MENAKIVRSLRGLRIITPIVAQMNAMIAKELPRMEGVKTVNSIPEHSKEGNGATQIPAPISRKSDGTADVETVLQIE